MRDRKIIEGERVHTLQPEINNQILILEVLLDIRDALHAVGETGGKDE